MSTLDERIRAYANHNSRLVQGLQELALVFSGIDATKEKVVFRLPLPKNNLVANIEIGFFTANWIERERNERQDAESKRQLVTELTRKTISGAIEWEIVTMNEFACDLGSSRVKVTRRLFQGPFFLKVFDIRGGNMACFSDKELGVDSDGPIMGLFLFVNELHSTRHSEERAEASREVISKIMGELKRREP